MVIKVKDIDSFKKMILIKGFSQRSLARTIEISEPYANQIANGTRNPGPVIAKKICSVLECSFDEIFFVEDACNSYQGAI